MIDAFLTSPDDLPPLRFCRSSRRAPADARSPNVTPFPEPSAKLSPPVTGVGLAASVVLVVSMIALPSLPADGTWSKVPGGPYRTL